MPDLLAPWPVAWVMALAVPLALLIDAWWGEPPVAWHPVVWIGRALQVLGDRVAPLAMSAPSATHPGAGPAADLAANPTANPTANPAADWPRFWRGAAAWVGVAMPVAAVAWMAQWAVLQAPGVLAAVLMGLLLKPLLAWRMLRDEVLAVEAALGESLAAGRARLAWLVSRDVQQLDEAAVRESAIETLAENLCDSVVAPLFWFVLLGLPGAALYRFANTADAMWGYPGMRGGRYWQWAGKWAARADDVLSWLPARLTALLLWAAALGAVRWRDVRTQARVTPSPNGGWPMGAMALALGVRLSKPGVYVLNAAGRVVLAGDSERALRLAARWRGARCPPSSRAAGRCWCRASTCTCRRRPRCSTASASCRRRAWMT